MKKSHLFLAGLVASLAVLGLASGAKADTGQEACAIKPTNVRAFIYLTGDDNDPAVTLTRYPLMQRTIVNVLEPGTCVEVDQNSRNYWSDAGHTWVITPDGWIAIRNDKTGEWNVKLRPSKKTNSEN
jgi:hypothetical protein